jgi:hypothetical protein
MHRSRYHLGVHRVDQRNGFTEHAQCADQMHITSLHIMSMNHVIGKPGTNVENYGSSHRRVDDAIRHLHQRSRTRRMEQGHARHPHHRDSLQLLEMKTTVITRAPSCDQDLVTLTNQLLGSIQSVIPAPLASIVAPQRNAFLGTKRSLTYRLYRSK